MASSLVGCPTRKPEKCLSHEDPARRLKKALSFLLRINPT